MTNQIFDNYDSVNKCNHCEEYYVSTCDGLSKDKSKCPFKPIRKDLFGTEIKRLKIAVGLSILMNIVLFVLVAGLMLK